MNISKIFIDRPIATSLMMLAIALFGMIAYRSLPVSDLPNVDYPTVRVTANLPGASPETMAAAVATPLENQFSMIAGLGSMTSTNSLGSTQITLEFDLSRNLDCAAVDVQAAITQASRLLPAGMPTPPTFTKVNPADQPILYIALTSPTLPLYTLDEYAETRIAQRISMISGVAQVQVLGAQKYAVHAQMDPHSLASRQIGMNEIESALKNLLPLFKAELPPSVNMDILYDRSDTIRESYTDVKFTMLLTLGLVVLVIFLFLRNVSATIIPSLALPFSIVGTFAVMYLLDYSLDNLSMMALILSIGFVVDDAIVMLENIVRPIEMAEDPLTASLNGSGEIGFTIVSMTLSLAAVFIPVLFMGGVLGRLFKEFAVTITVAILISGVVSVTLTPMLCSRFLKGHHEGRLSWFYNVTEKFFDGMLHVYDVTLQLALRHRVMMMLSFLAVLGATLYMFVK